MYYPGYPAYPYYGNQEGNGTNWLWIIIIFVVLFVINILKDIRLQKKASK